MPLQLLKQQSAGLAVLARLHISNNSPHKCGDNVPEGDVRSSRSKSLVQRHEHSSWAIVISLSERT